MTLDRRQKITIAGVALFQLFWLLAVGRLTPVDDEQWLFVAIAAIAAGVLAQAMLFAFAVVLNDWTDSERFGGLFIGMWVLTSIQSQAAGHSFAGSPTAGYVLFGTCLATIPVWVFVVALTSIARRWNWRWRTESDPAGPLMQFGIGRVAVATLLFAILFGATRFFVMYDPPRSALTLGMPMGLVSAVVLASVVAGGAVTISNFTPVMRWPGLAATIAVAAGTGYTLGVGLTAAGEENRLSLPLAAAFSMYAALLGGSLIALRYAGLRIDRPAVAAPVESENVAPLNPWTVEE